MAETDQNPQSPSPPAEPVKRGKAPLGKARPLDVTTWIILINLGVYLANSYTRVATVDAVSGQVLRKSAGRLFDMGFFSIDAAVNQLQLWRWLSFQFLHDPNGLLHIGFNMFMLFVFGPMVEDHLGRRRFLVFYLMCGVAGPLMFMVLNWLGPLSSLPDTMPLVGASAGIFGVLVAAAKIAPDEIVEIPFPPVPIKLRSFAWIMVGIALFVVLTSGPMSKQSNAGGEAAHLGGALMGYVLVRRPDWLGEDDPTPPPF